MRSNKFLSILLSLGLLTVSSCSSGGSSSGNSVIPQGTWHQANSNTISDNLLYATSLSVYNGQVAVAGLDKSQLPQVYTCNSSIDSCTLQTITATLPNASNIEAVQYDNNGSLNAVFLAPNSSTLLSSLNSSYFYKLNGGQWESQYVVDGTFTNLQFSPDNVLISTGHSELLFSLFDYGDIFVSSLSDRAITNYDSIDLEEAAITASNQIFVGGRDRADTTESSPCFYVWAYDKNQPESKAFTKVSVLPKFLSIKGMAVNVNNIYVAGGAQNYADHVWLYNGSQATDLGFIGYTVNQLLYSPEGYLLAIGLDNEYQEKIFVYNLKQSKWAILDVPYDPQDLDSIAIDSVSHNIYVAGNSSTGSAQVWYFVIE